MPVPKRSVEKVTITLFDPESVELIFEVDETRFKTTDVDPVFPETSVATILRLFDHGTKLGNTIDHVHEPSVARFPFTRTFATHHVSDTSQKSVGMPTTTAPLA